MPLSPIDVTQQTFRVSLRGYDEGEVDAFLDDVVSSMKEYDQKIREADERVSILEEQLRANRETEDAMRRAFVAAQRAADEIVAEARTDAERIVAEAGAEATQVSAEQVHERDKLQNELLVLRQTVKDLKQRMASVAEGVLPELDALDADLDAVVDVADTPRTTLAQRVASLSPADDVAAHIPTFADVSQTSSDDSDSDSDEAMSPSDDTAEVPTAGTHRAGTDSPVPKTGWLTSPEERLPGRGMPLIDVEQADESIDESHEATVAEAAANAVDDDAWDTAEVHSPNWGQKDDTIPGSGWGSESADEATIPENDGGRRRPWER